MSRSFLLAPLALLTTITVAACGHSGPSVGDQCNSVVKTINAGQQKIQGTKDSSNLAKDAEALAKNVDGVIADLDKLNIADPDLKKMVTDYEGAMKTYSSAMTDMAGVMKKMDTKPDDLKTASSAETQMDAIGKQVDKASKDEDALVDKLNNYCKDKL